jgi:putative flavoprotein involved in K+ transport
MANPSRLIAESEPSTPNSFVEPGETYRKLSRLSAAKPAAGERYDVVVIGGGQAGLSVGYHLAKRGLKFVILDAHARIGDAWRKRWDSLRLFTPARYSSLTGMPFPALPYSFPTKDEFADYLEAYASRFRLPVHCSRRATSLRRVDGVFRIDTGDQLYEAAQVVIAMSNYQRGRSPGFASQLDSSIVQLHSSDYKNPSQLQPGEVLIAGAGNSGSEIAMELSRSHRVWMSGRDTGHVPFRIDGFWARLIMLRLVLRVVFHYLLTIRTPVGRKARAKLIHVGGPLIRVKPRDLQRVGVRRVAKVIGVRDGLPQLEGGRTLRVTNVVWCTGYHPNFSWIELPAFEGDGAPRHTGGIVHEVPGLYFVGLHFLYSHSSTMIHGVGRDAKRIVGEIARRA